MTTSRQTIAYAFAPKAVLKTRPWYPGEGSVRVGNFEDAAQSNLPSRERRESVGVLGSSAEGRGYHRSQ